MIAKQNNGKVQEFAIQSVANNQEKSDSYKENLDRYDKAKESGFYLESLWILYAMIEDRTSSLLYYIGFTSARKRSSVTGTKKIKKEIREIFALDNKKGIRYKFDTLGGKFTRIKELLAWCKAKHKTLSEYQQELVKVIQPVADSSEFNESLDYLGSEWRVKRNQLVHALFNKNSNAVLNELLSLVEKGYEAATQLSEGVKKIEAIDKKHNIRSKFKIQ